MRKVFRFACITAMIVQVIGISLLQLSYARVRAGSGAGDCAAKSEINLVRAFAVYPCMVGVRGNVNNTVASQAEVAFNCAIAVEFGEVVTCIRRYFITIGTVGYHILCAVRDGAATKRDIFATSRADDYFTIIPIFCQSVTPP